VKGGGLQYEAYFTKKNARSYPKNNQGKKKKRLKW
jgi:hypothetical protein